MIEREIGLVAQVFARELTKLRERAGREDSFQSESLELSVKISYQGEPAFELSYRLGDYGERIKAGELRALLAEVARRQGWEDYQAGEMQEAGRALRGLPAPAEPPSSPAEAVEWLEAQEAEGDPGAKREEDYGARRDDE